jgi:hypothetical protein
MIPPLQQQKAPADQMRLKSQFQPVGFDSGKIEGQKLFFPFRHCWKK